VDSPRGQRPIDTTEVRGPKSTLLQGSANQRREDSSCWRCSPEASPIWELDEQRRSLPEPSMQHKKKRVSGTMGQKKPQAESEGEHLAIFAHANCETVVVRPTIPVVTRSPVGYDIHSSAVPMPLARTQRVKSRL